ncbi:MULTISPECIES: nucleotidyltransferase family protein [unclassified Moorena]|uniref:nucleotidyltransferase family protein n=1 Tax=unclassified Moorena TaxID=2683338 RepID=UPI001401756B|nr:MULTISPECIES: nucleotidyltransferase family protein [unclassified Moorena]NEO17531.1 nucleotidyltransferase family protein [Moorena sp. SIO3E8]NEQ04061.1 nucleotidyltransferase family protein [Moorena sp. SIO3F7]
MKNAVIEIKNLLKLALGIHPQLVRPEAKLLLCCARTKLDPDLVDQIQLLVQQDLDWPWIVGMAQQQKVLPLLFRNLSYLECTQIPSDLWQYMQAKVRSITLYNLSLTRTLVKLLPQLEARGIAAIPYKGPTLAAAAYGDLALREFVDLDLLVREPEGVTK